MGCEGLARTFLTMIENPVYGAKRFKDLTWLIWEPIKLDPRVSNLRKVRSPQTTRTARF